MRIQLFRNGGTDSCVFSVMVFIHVTRVPSEALTANTVETATVMFGILSTRRMYRRLKGDSSIQHCWVSPRRCRSYIQVRRGDIRQ